MLLDFLDNLQAYNLNEGAINRIQLIRDVQSAEFDYFWKAFAVPSKDPSLQGNGDRLDPYQTYKWQFQVARGSYLTMLSCYSEQSEGFSVQITDVGSGGIMATGMPPRNGLYGNFETQTDPDEPIGPTFITPNFTITDKELVAVEIKNLSASANRVQVCLEFAIPNQPSTTGTVSVSGMMPATAN